MSLDTEASGNMLRVVSNRGHQDSTALELMNLEIEISRELYRSAAKVETGNLAKGAAARIIIGFPVARNVEYVEDISADLEAHPTIKIECLEEGEVSFVETRTIDQRSSCRSISCFSAIVRDTYLPG